MTRKQTRREKRAQRTTDELRRGVVDICYLVDQLLLIVFWELMMWPKLRPPPEHGGTEMHGVANAVLESSLISARLLDDFLRDGPCKDDDLQACQYPGFSGYRPFLGAERTPINKYLTHLTTHRAKERNWWPFLAEKIPSALDQIENFFAYLESRGSVYLPKDRTLGDLTERKELFAFVRTKVAQVVPRTIPPRG